MIPKLFVYPKVILVIPVTVQHYGYLSRNIYPNRMFKNVDVKSTKDNNYSLNYLALIEISNNCKVSTFIHTRLESPKGT